MNEPYVLCGVRLCCVHVICGSPQNICQSFLNCRRDNIRSAAHTAAQWITIKILSEHVVSHVLACHSFAITENDFPFFLSASGERCDGKKNIRRKTEVKTCGIMSVHLSRCHKLIFSHLPQCTGTSNARFTKKSACFIHNSVANIFHCVCSLTSE